MLTGRESEEVLFADELGSDLGSVDDEDVIDIADIDTLRELQIAKHRAMQQDMAAKKASNVGLAEITEDEFLPTVLHRDAERCVVFFYHPQFARCQIMEKHLLILAAKHPETKFVKIEAERTPFFASKLNVKVLPCLVIFNHGKTVTKLIGFEGLSNGEDFPTGNLETWLGEVKVIDFKARKQRKANGLRVWRGDGDSDDDSDREAYAF